MGSVVNEAELYDFSEEEIAAVRNRFPRLTLTAKGCWDGEIDINAVYNDHAIQDQFKIGIVAPARYPLELPAMVELGGRTIAIAEKYKLSNKRDLHYNPRNGVACLCVKQEEQEKFPPGSNLATFIDNLVIPYLYGLSYYDQFGYWPWGEYSHGGLGLLEFYNEGSSEQTRESLEKVAKVIVRDDNWQEYVKQIKRPSSERFCMCGSKKPFRKCHPTAWKGLLKLQDHLKRLGIEPKQIYHR